MSNIYVSTEQWSRGIKDNYNEVNLNYKNKFVPTKKDRNIDNIKYNDCYTG